MDCGRRFQTVGAVWRVTPGDVLGVRLAVIVGSGVAHAEWLKDEVLERRGKGQAGLLFNDESQHVIG